ncbi:MAG: hypothetical protein E6G08_05815 [Actinobacteria bacterium]|nr:MAG: hypothetical protein E6G08_05815 [Actinomycetota bacterium]
MRKDVVIAEIGAAAALVGFALVFLGILITTYQSLLGRIATGTLAQVRTAGWISLVVTLLGLASVVLSTTWLVAGGGKTFYVATLVLFFAELAAVVAVAVYSTSQVLLR